MSNDGLMKIVFDKSMQVMSEYKELLAEALEITLVGEQENVVLKYSVENYRNNYFDVLLDLTNLTEKIDSKVRLIIYDLLYRHGKMSQLGLLNTTCLLIKI